MEKKLFKLIERNSVSIEESEKNGIIAHHVEVDDLIEDLVKLFAIPYVTNHVQNAGIQCGTCDNCILDDTLIHYKHFCKITGDGIEDINQHYCDTHYTRIG